MGSLDIAPGYVLWRKGSTRCFFFFPLKGMRDKGVVRGTRPSIQETRGRETVVIIEVTLKVTVNEGMADTG